MERRDFFRQVGLGLIAVSIGGGSLLLTPRQARAQGVDFRVLSKDEVAVLEALGDTLAPTAATEGIAHFVDYHLSVPPEDSLLMLRYLDIPPPYVGFYRAGLGNLESAAIRTYGKGFAELTQDQRNAMVEDMSRDAIDGWQGFPAALVYFALRADAVDVVYGTEEGFEKLGIPYMAHIAPPTAW